MNDDRSKSNILAILINLQKVFTARLKDGYEIPLENISVSDSSDRLDIVPPVEIFETEQVLGAHERGELISFTIPSEVKTYAGRISKFELNISQDTQIKIQQLSNEETIELPLVELRIDPLSLSKKE